MAPDSNTWKAPVLFHFQVEFQWNGNKASASFAEVDGLGQELMLDEQAVKSGRSPGFPKGIKVNDIVLKRALEPLNESITVWLKNSFSFLHTGWVEPRTINIYLLDEKGGIVAGWVCERAIPIKWSVNPLNASESKIAVESITLRHTMIRRNK